jgi:hypothetical protein
MAKSYRVAAGERRFRVSASVRPARAAIRLSLRNAASATAQHLEKAEKFE